MAPSIECSGCGTVWRTMKEPATKGQMQKLINAAATHRLNVSGHSPNVDLVWKLENGESSNETFTYNETTPKEHLKQDAAIVIR